MKFFIGIGVVFCIVFSCVIGLYLFTDPIKRLSKYEPTQVLISQPTPSRKEKQDQFINDYLGRASSGLNCDFMFCSSNRANFNSLRNSQILALNSSGKGYADYTVRIESSDSRGFSIIRDYSIGIRTKDFPDEEKDYCITGIYAK